METSLNKSVKEENKASDQSHGDIEDSYGEEIVLQVGAGKRVDKDDGMKQPSPDQQQRLSKGSTMTKIEALTPEYDSRSSSPAKREQLDEQLESTKAEMDEVMEENQRLKLYLDRILKDYRTLQMRYRDVIHQDHKNSINDHKNTLPNHHHNDHGEEEPEFIALSLGRTSSSELIKDEHRKTPSINGKLDKEGLSLGLDCKFETPKAIEPSKNDRSSENSLEEVKEEGGETWSNNKNGKNARDGGDDDISLQNPAKRARVSVRIRCDTPTMNDGCQWRKYGQKIAKGNPCPRAYYRCTVAPSCPVRKQVQRCAEDMSILITTYEGTHNHPLPISATAMASTTSAAASMLMSGSTTSGSGLSSSSTTMATGTATTATINGLNFYLSDNSRSKPFYLPNSSISSSPSFPTITLDLTSNSSSSSSHLSRLGNLIPSRYPSTNLNFSSLESNALPTSWSNGMFVGNYGSNPFNKNQTSTTNSLIFGTQNHESLYQSYLHKNPNPSNQTSLPPDTIAAATKAIASDPSFQSALAAALSSIIGSGSASTSQLGNQSIGEKLGQSIKSNTEPFPILSSFPTMQTNANKCVPSFLNNSSSSTSSQPAGGLKFPPSSFLFSGSKSKSNSPGDSREHLL